MISPALLKEFRVVLGHENVLTDMADLVTYSYDAAVLEPVVPAIALRPVSGKALNMESRVTT